MRSGTGVRRRSSSDLAVVRGGGVLTVRDDGCGFEVASRSQSGLGLRIMKYRAKMIGGSLEVESSPDAGTLIRCQFPVADRVVEAENAS